MSVMATEDPTLPDPEENKPGGTARFYSQEELDDMLAKARQQEKNKLYPTISKADERTKAMQDELKELRAFQKKQEKAEADRQAAVDKARKEAEEAELSAKDLIARRQQEFDARMAQFQQEQDLKIALLEKQNEMVALQAYIQRRVNEEQDSIAPELLDFITGDTPEQVEASVERVKAKTAQLVESMKSAGARQRAGMPGVAPAAGTNGIGPLDTPGDRQLTADDIKGMGMADYKALRDKIGLAGAGGQGLWHA